jgi:hypothetical protein
MAAENGSDNRTLWKEHGFVIANPFWEGFTIVMVGQKNASSADRQRQFRLGSVIFLRCQVPLDCLPACQFLRATAGNGACPLWSGQWPRQIQAFLVGALPPREGGSRLRTGAARWRLGGSPGGMGTWVKPQRWGSHQPDGGKRGRTCSLSSHSVTANPHMPWAPQGPDQAASSMAAKGSPATGGNTAPADGRSRDDTPPLGGSTARSSRQSRKS